jgi:rhodanese-related sulfurtransferase
MMQQNNPGSAPGTSSRRLAFSWRRIIKDCLYFVALAILVGGLLNFSLLANAFNGTLIPKIQQNQLADLKLKSAKLNPEISFIDLPVAKKLYDEKTAIFLDARAIKDYEAGHISGAINLPARDLLKGNIDPNKILPDKGAVLISYCDGGECELSLDIAKVLSERGYLNIFILGEGYPGWQGAGYPVDK